MLAVILSVDDPWILLWFNAEQIETVNWAGNPHKDRSDDLTLTLTPRSSFEARAETVSGRARAWTLPELDAAMRLRITGRPAESPCARTQLATDGSGAGQGLIVAAEEISGR
jgi:light-regulated signal transduction histidine kinase (bacteriophytochrome)